MIIEALAPLIVVALALCVAVVVAVNIVGSKLDRHNEWLRRIELSLGNLHKSREQAYARSLRVVRPEGGGPPTLSDAGTTEVTADMLSTLKLDPKNRKDGPG
jgi:hypothetical protein